MKNYKEMTKCILDARDEYDARKRHQQVIIKRCTIALSSACCAVLICFGIFVTWEKINKLPDVEVQPANSIISDNTDTTASNNSKTSSTTVVTDNRVSATTAKASKFVSAKVSAEQDTEHDAMTEETAVSEESVSADTPIKAETQPPVPTEQPAETLPQMTETDERKAVKGAFKIRRLLESEDPITVFDKINVGGKNYEGRKYITANDLDGFLIAWIEEMTLTKDDTVLNERVVEPVTVYGIMENDRNEIIVNFTNDGCDIYGYYWAIEDTEDQPTADNG